MRNEKSREIIRNHKKSLTQNKFYDKNFLNLRLSNLIKHGVPIIYNSNISSKIKKS